MVAETGAIRDPRRILNRDETPQFINYSCNKGNAKRKSATGVGHLALSNDDENRECPTVDMTIGLGGFLYGLHILLKRNTVSEALCIDEFEGFDEMIDEKFMFSSFGTLSTTERGVQTCVLCLGAYKMLDR